jgi:gluconate 2-dehydrogenase alpha chain
MTGGRAIVIGSGVSGGQVARLLAMSGQWDVTVLEKGRNFFTGLGGPAENVGNMFANDELAYEVRNPPIVQDPILEPRSFRTQPSSGDRTFVGNVQFLPTTVGGGTVHYDAKFRRFREVDFITNTLMGGTADRPAIAGTTYTDWPMQYKHMEPFYAVSEEILGVQGPAYRSGGGIVNPNPYESWRSTPFPMPPGVQMLASLLPAESAQRLGYHPAAVPTAVNSRPYRGRQACSDCGYCLNYGCPSNAKASGAWPLNDALLTGRTTLITQANVTGIDYGKATNGRYRARGVTYIDGDGNQRHLAADLVVLANTPIEATRLSILSGIANPANQANLNALVPSATEPSGLLGRNLMFHLQTIAIAIFDQDIHSWRGRCSTQTLDAFAGSGPTPAQFDPLIPRGGITEIGGNRNPISEANSLAGLIFGDLHKTYMELGPFTNRIASLTLQGEDMPQLSNYVDLDPSIVDVYGQPVPRITYHSHPYELAAAAYYAPQMLAVLENIGSPGSAYDVQPLFAGAINTVLPPVAPGPVDQVIGPLLADTPFSEVPASQHIMGTHRMALDRDHGPCDPYGRYWAFDNLYHAGGGLFCTAAGYNVTLTMAALSYRVGAGIVSGAGGLDAYTAADVDQGQAALEGVVRALDSDTMIARALA